MDPASRTNPDGAEDLKHYDRTNVILMKLFEYQLHAPIPSESCLHHPRRRDRQFMMANRLPQHKPGEMMTGPGCGYSLRLDAEMWMRDHIAKLLMCPMATWTVRKSVRSANISK